MMIEVASVYVMVGFGQHREMEVAQRLSVVTDGIWECVASLVGFEVRFVTSISNG